MPYCSCLICIALGTASLLRATPSESRLAFRRPNVPWRGCRPFWYRQRHHDPVRAMNERTVEFFHLNDWLVGGGILSHITRGTHHDRIRNSKEAYRLACLKCQGQSALEIAAQEAEPRETQTERRKPAGSGVVPLSITTSSDVYG
jgi:hypothetical protein